MKTFTEIKPGETFKIDDVEFVKILDCDGATTAMTKDIVFRSAFGENNNFAESEILDKLKEKFLPKIVAAVGEENLLDFETDLTTLDGLKTFGKITSKVSLPTLDLYRDNIEIFDKHKLVEWYWLATAFSAMPHYNSSIVLCVAPSGNINNNNYNNNNGVRPYWRNVRQSRQQPKSVHPFKRTHNLSLRINKKDYACMTDFEKVIDFNNMYKAYRKSKSGKGFKKSSAKFSIMALDGINTLIEQLRKKTYFSR